MTWIEGTIFDYERDKNKHVEEIIQSSSRYKLVVAGPGTGKTFLFRKICESRKENVLLIVFINNLASNLANELGDVAECGTFHALCKKLIYSLPVKGIDTFNYFPKLDSLLESDKTILAPKLGPLKEAFEHYRIKDDRIVEHIKAQIGMSLQMHI